MPTWKGLEWTFDTVASAYEKMRPGYAQALYRAIFDYIPVGEGSRVIEVGSGGGQATAPMLKTGCRLTAVEYGEQLSALLREKFQEYETFSVITGNRCARRQLYGVRHHGSAAGAEDMRANEKNR
ncbi:MAG: hypothetical protein IJW40_03235 [Clostridia bacterium]|nr:hypothetical protein [Clostridia bacterium]